MPFIDLKVTTPLSEDTRETIKSELGSAVAVIHKSETYLMVGIEDSYDLWLGGRHLEKGAYVSVSLYGNASSSDYNELTGKICTILEQEAGIPGDAVYVSYHPVSDWGWNGSNF